MKKTVLVTGIGGNQGQGVLRNLLKLSEEIVIIGTNTSRVSGGNHLCDEVYEVPPAISEGYISKLAEICHKEAVDLIIPTTDAETYALAKNTDQLPEIVVSPFQTSEIFFNKYKTAQAFHKHSIPFAKTTLPSVYKGEFAQIIVKPAEGRGSRNIHKDPPNVVHFSDEYVVQEFYGGEEITTAFYVTKEGKLHGYITFLRELASGATNKCEVTHHFDEKVEKIITQMIRHFTIVGPCNIQAIVTNSGEVVPFEINGRISGTNSIRANFGFEDVKYIIDEYLFDREPEKPVITKGSAVRILMDVIYPDIPLTEVHNKKTKHYIS